MTTAISRLSPANHRAEGFGLLDGLLYLGLAAVAIGGVFSVYRSATTNSKSNDAVTGVGQIVANVRSMFPTQNYPSGVAITQTLFAGGLLPGGYTQSGTAAPYSYNNPFGGNISVTGGGTSFVIFLNGIPSAACASIAQTFAQPGGSGATFVANNLALSSNSLNMLSTLVAASDVGSWVTSNCTSTGQGSGNGNSVALAFQ